jgi:peptidoglycan hydrolase-like protein with peptidoglycan-binding domain
VKIPKRNLRVKVQGLDGKSPLAGQAFEIVAGGKTVKGQVAPDGLVEGKIPASATTATLTIPGLGFSLRLAVGELDPTCDGAPTSPIVSGVQARLANLGYYAGPTCDRFDEATKSALAAFQREVMGRESADGELDEETLDRLAVEHGC